MQKLLLLGFQYAFVKDGSHVFRVSGRNCNCGTRPTQWTERIVEEALSNGELRADHLVKLDCNSSDEESYKCTSSDRLADHIHELLDNTAAQGDNSPLEILWFWFLDDDKNMSLKLHSLLFGALRRSVEWHQGSVTIIHSLQVDNCFLKDWSIAMQCSTVRLEQLSNWGNIRAIKLNHSLVWHGPIYFISQKPGGETACLAGCELHCDAAELSSNAIVPSDCTTWIEVVAFLHETKVPLGLLSLATQYSLTCLNSQYDNGSCLAQLQKFMVAENVCMLVRLCHSEQTELPVGPHLHEQWIEHVIGADDSNFSFSLDCSVDHLCTQGRLLLAMANNITDEPRLRVYVLRHVEELQTGLSVVPVVDSLRQLEPSVIEDVASVLSELPCCGGQDEPEWNDKKWLQSLSESLRLANKLLNPDSLPERIALQNEEQLLKSLKSMTSPDPLLDTLLAPNPEDLNLNVEELLQYFSNDGQATCLSLSPVKTLSSSLALRPHRSYSTADAGELKSLSFYEAARLSAHGVDYCVDDQASLSVDRRLARIQLRYVSSETNSTCASASTPTIQIGKRRSLTTCLTPPQTKPKHMKTEVSTTPRRSPRKHPGSLRSWRTRTSPRKLSRKPYSDRQRRTLGTRDVVLESGDLEGQSKSTVVETGIAVDHDRQQESVQGKHSMVDVRNSKLARQGRSERHKQRLQKVVQQTLKQAGLTRKDPSFQRCVDRLFHICHGYLKDLKTSKNLKEEMVNVAEQNAQQVIKFEKRQSTESNSS